jgi:hypothetical protein
MGKVKELLSQIDEDDFYTVYYGQQWSEPVLPDGITDEPTTEWNYEEPPF